MVLNDALTFLGTDLRLAPFQRSDVDLLRRMLDRYAIGRAFVAALACKTVNVARGNEMVFEAAADGRLVPCPAVLPDSGGEVGDEAAFVDGLIRDGARCVCFYPQTFGTTLDRRVIGPLFSALARRRLPVALFETEPLAAADLAADFPDLPVIVHGPAYRNRTLLPALAAAPNLHISVRPNFAPYRGLEVLVERFGAGRILLASGYPVHEPGAAIGYVMLSAISDADAAAIAGGNMARLIAGVGGAQEQAGVRESATGKPTAAIAKTASGEVDPAKTAGGQSGGLYECVRRREPIGVDGVIDMHTHLGQYVRFPMWGGDADDLVAEMDRLGVERIFVSHEACLSPEVAWGNDQVLAAIARHPSRILGYAACYPMDERLGLAEIQRCIDAGMHGIKMHDSAGIAYTDPAYEPIWAYADAAGLPVLLHTWADLDKLDPIFQRFTRPPILLGHAGAGHKAEMYVDYARRYPNLVLDLCYSMAPYGLVEFFVNEVGPEQIVWSSDAPWMSMQQQLGRVLLAEIADQQKRTILVETPRRVLAGRI